MKKLSSLLSVLLLMGCSQAEPQPQSATANPQDFTISNAASGEIRHVDFSDVAAKTIDAVVHIKTEMTKLTPLYESFFGFIIDRGMQQKSYTAFGSGVIISSDGYIITNNHVVQDAEKITVTLNNRHVLPATLVGNDPATDLALLKVDADSLHFIPFGNSDKARVGEPVLAIGNPFNLTSTVTAGIISAKARNVNIIENADGQESPIESFIKTDAAVNSGNSGGALVNSQGNLIGIITAIASGNGYYTGYSFAIPSNLAAKVANDLKHYGYVQRAYLGINVSEGEHGVVIQHLFANCAAQRAGLKVGDILRTIESAKISSYSEMMEEIGRLNPGDEITVGYERNGKLHEAKVVLLNSKGTTEVLTREQVEAERLKRQQEQQRQAERRRSQQRFYIPY